MLPEWVIEKKLKEIDADDEYCKLHNIDPHDYDEEYEIEAVRFVRWHVFWIRKITEWKPFYGNRREFLAYKGRKRFKFRCMKEWKVYEPKDGEGEQE